MRRPVRLGAFLTAALFAVAASVSLAQQVRPVEPGGPGHPPLPHPLPHPVQSSAPLPHVTAMPTAAPGASPLSSMPPNAAAKQFGLMRMPSRRNHFGRGPGIPLSRLPQLPAKTAQNTAYFTGGGLPARRTMAATGATIIYFADTFFNSNCSSAVGTLIPIGCDVFWAPVPSQMPNGTDTCEDFYISLTNANTPTAYDDGGPSPPSSSTYTCNQGSWQYNNIGANDTPDMNTTGTYVLATEDVTKGKWQAVVYVSVGNVNVFGTYADSAATTAQQQFTAANGTNVYINATGLTQGQSYVVYIESTGTNVFCEYIAPPSGSATPNPSGFCDPTQSAGITAVVGAQSSAAITAVWPLSSSTPTGTYAVVLYNLTTGQRLAMRQVSITGSSGAGTISLTPTSGNASLGSNWPTPPPSPGSVTKFPFDSTTEESDKGWSLSASGLSASTKYTLTVTDPTGTVVSGPTTLTSTASGTISTTWTFSNTQSPSNYISNVYTVQLLKQSTSTVAASQAFQILGYDATTQFQDTSTLAYSTAIVLPQSSTVTKNLVFTNSGDTLYGTGNGDTISGIAFNTGAKGITTSLSGGVASMTVADSAGNNWTVTNSCYGGNGANAGCTITAYPTSSSTTLAAGAYLSIPSVDFSNAPGNSNCQTGCTGSTAILPAKGASWSTSGSNASTNTVYFTNSFSASYAGTAQITHTGYLDTSNTFHSGQETHGFTYNQTNTIYTSQSPTAATSGYADIYSFTVVNNDGAGTTNIKELEIVLPTAYTPSGTLTTWSVYSGGTGNWTAATCPTGAPTTAVCVSSTTGINPVGGTDTFSLSFTPPPPSSFSFTDWTVEAVTPTQFTLTPSGTFTGFVPSTLSYDTTATAAYSLTANLITPAFSPTSTGQNTNNSMTINVTNTSTAQDSNPDYLDLIAIDLPTTNAFSSLGSMPTGWSLLGTTTVGGNTRYFFGLCAAQVTTYTVTASVTSCGSATEANSIAPGKTFTVTGNLQTGTSNITATMYAHGANGNGWSDAHTFTLNVTAVAAAAGFNGAGGYPSASSVTSPNTPQVGADSDSTYGNAYSYVIKNTSGTGQNITSAKIVIPGLDVSSVLPSDGTYWQVTNAPSTTNSYNCSVTSYTSANRTGTNNGYGAYNGGITIGGGSCSIPPGGSITVTFDAKAPYTVNDSYQFTTTVNGSVSAAEMWQTDTFVQIILGATLSVAVDPGNPGPGGSTPSVNCAVCSFNTTTNLIDFGTIANGTTVTGTDVLRVSIYTNAGSSNAWKLYVSTNNNPANTTSPANELLTSIDSVNSAPRTGINFDQTTYAVVPTASSLLLMDNGTGLTASRTPYDAIMNFEISIQGGSTAPQTSVLTYTFIAN
jgi:hypothetical protein